MGSRNSRQQEKALRSEDFVALKGFSWAHRCQRPTGPPVGCSWKNTSVTLPYLSSCGSKSSSESHRVWPYTNRKGPSSNVSSSQVINLFTSKTVAKGGNSYGPWLSSPVEENNTDTCSSDIADPYTLLSPVEIL